MWCIYVRNFSLLSAKAQFWWKEEEKATYPTFSICYIATKEIPCSHFFFGDVLQCNVKCGQGLQHRNVICRDGSGHPSSACDFAVKPVTRQPCTGQICDEANEDVRQKKTATLEEHENDQVTTGWMKINSGILKPPAAPVPSTPNTENTTEIMTEAISATVDVATTAKPRIPSEPTWVTIFVAGEKKERQRVV